MIFKRIKLLIENYFGMLLGKCLCAAVYGNIQGCYTQLEQCGVW